jgi:hypothetical protein
MSPSLEVCALERILSCSAAQAKPNSLRPAESLIERGWSLLAHPEGVKAA